MTDVLNRPSFVGQEVMKGKNTTGVTINRIWQPSLNDQRPSAKDMPTSIYRYVNLEQSTSIGIDLLNKGPDVHSGQMIIELYFPDPITSLLVSKKVNVGHAKKLPISLQKQLFDKVISMKLYNTNDQKNRIKEQLKIFIDESSDNIIPLYEEPYLTIVKLLYIDSDYISLKLGRFVDQKTFTDNRSSIILYTMAWNIDAGSVENAEHYLTYLDYFEHDDINSNMYLDLETFDIITKNEVNEINDDGETEVDAQNLQDAVPAQSYGESDLQQTNYPDLINEDLEDNDTFYQPEATIQLTKSQQKNLRKKMAQIKKKAREQEQEQLELLQARQNEQFGIFGEGMKPKKKVNFVEQQKSIKQKQRKSDFEKDSDAYIKKKFLKLLLASKNKK
jgi:hypothetical protein